MLRERAYEMIREDIIKLRLAPGEALVEVELAQRYKTSKTPVREALTALLREGLVEHKPNKGFTVSPVSVRDIHEIYEARAFIESALVRLAVQRITDGELRELEGLAEARPETQAADAVDRYIRADEELHMSIARAARNGRLFGYYRSLLDEARRLLYMDLGRHDTLPAWHAAHAQIIEALRRRDVEGAVRAIEESTTNAQARLISPEWDKPGSPD